jgi:hypothetical protein
LDTDKAIAGVFAPEKRTQRYTLGTFQWQILGAMNPRICLATEDSRMDFPAKNADSAHSIQRCGQVLITT